METARRRAVGIRPRPAKLYRVLVSARFKAAEDSEVPRFFEEKLRFESK